VNRQQTAVRAFRCARVARKPQRPYVERLVFLRGRRGVV
jgi:hypothetical protein